MRDSRIRLSLLILYCLLQRTQSRGNSRFSPLSLWQTRGGSADTGHHSSTHAHHHTRRERGFQLSTPIHPDEVYNAWKTIQKDYYEKAFSNPNWKLLKARHGVEVSLLSHPTDPSCPYVKMTYEMPVSVKDCWDFLLLEHWDKNMPKMDPFYEGVSVHGEFNIANTHMLLCRKRTKRLMAFGKRDLVFLSVTEEPLEDGTWVSGSVSVETPTIPRDKHYTRAFQDSLAFYKPIDNNQRCALTIMCRIDLNDSSEDGAGGFIPMWMYVKTIGRTGVMSVLKMKDAIVQDLKERAASFVDDGDRSEEKVTF